jgi:hypothetical protein
MPSLCPMLLTIVDVSLFTCVLIWGLWRMSKSMERAEQDPKYLRRIFWAFGMVCLGASALQVINVVSGRDPMITLVGTPVGLEFAWFGFRMASRVKISPK